MAAGVPVVASAVGGIPDQIRHDKEGLLVPPGDTDALADALLALLRDPDRARRLGEAGRRRATSRFNHATMVRQIEDVYRDILGHPATRSVTPGEPGLRTTR
jgi:glycosyltransferase involved in cell wall biosynthesis